MTTTEQLQADSTTEVTPDPILRLASGFMAAKHLFAASELGLFEALADAPASLDALAARTGLTPRAARISADAMVALGILERDGDVYRNSPTADRFLAGKAPSDLRPLLRLWDRISYPAIVVDHDQDLATDDDRPSLFGHPFDGPMPGHGPGPRSGELVDYTTRVALRELGRRAAYLAEEIERVEDLILPLLTKRAPALLAVRGVGPDCAAILLIAAGDHPERLRSEAAWAHLCGSAPIPASSGKTVRRRLNPAGDRQANHALWRIVLCRMSFDPRTRRYVERRLVEGKTKPEIIRCLKRYVAREVYPLLRLAVAD